MKSKHAQVHFNENGIPVADHFDDVYYSNDSGINETQHVFIQGNDLHQRWALWDKPHFNIAETGFGTGLNFLVVMHEFKLFRHANPHHPLKRLFFLTTEKYPLPKADIQRALATFETLQTETDALMAVYPIGLDGCHRLHFAAFDTTLDLWIGDVHQLLGQWHSPEEGLVDAWFLDGFAPSKNPDMWTDALFEQMARLSKNDTTFATFTAAGIVKRGLAHVGFAIRKRAGFGRKRDMLTGRFQLTSANEIESNNIETSAHFSPQSVPFSSPETTKNKHIHKLRLPEGPYYRYNTVPLSEEHHVVVVGSGLAAATMCLALTKRNIRVTLCFDGDSLAQGASGNPQGGFYPQLHSEASIASRLQAHCFLYARDYYDSVSFNSKLQASTKESDTDLETSTEKYDFCGVIQLRFNDKVGVRQTKLVNDDVWPSALIRHVDSDEVRQIAGVNLPYEGLFIPKGGWLSPPQLVSDIIELARVTGNLTLKPNHCYVSHTSDGDVEFTHGESIKADHVVLALGAGAVGTDAFGSLPLRPVRGQVEAVESQPPIDALKTVLCHKGYMTPAMEGRHALGSTYVKNDLAVEPREDESKQNLATHEQALANTDMVSKLKHDGMARAATRLGSPDHQPVVGALHNFKTLKQEYADLGVGKPFHQVSTLPKSNVSTLSCLGSRGLTTAPLLAEVLASTLLREPLPLNNDLLNAVNTSRFMVREAVRGEF